MLITKYWRYKQYVAQVNYCLNTKVFYGSIINKKELTISFTASDIKSLKLSFIDTVKNIAKLS